MQERLRTGPGEGCAVGSFKVKDYPDTKIKMHFSHFKILVSRLRALSCKRFCCSYCATKTLSARLQKRRKAARDKEGGVGRREGRRKGWKKGL